MEVLNKEKVLEHAKKLIDEGKFDRAVLEYKKLLDIDPRDMRIKIRIAELYIRQKKIGDAIKAYQEVAESYTDDGFYLKAVTVYKNVLRLNPSLMDVNRSLAELYEKMGLNRDAIHQYQILANSIEQKGDHQALVAIRKRMVALDPHNIQARIRLAETYQFQGMEEDSLNEYEMLVDEVKESGTQDQLTDLYEKILSYRPDNLEMIKALTKIYFSRNEWKKVVERLDKTKELSSSQVDLLLMQAVCYSKLNQIETAKNKYKEAAEIFIGIGQVDKALEAYRDILVIAPDRIDEVKEAVDEIDPLLFEKIKAEADVKREEIAAREAELQAEEERRALEEETGPMPGEKPEEKPAEVSLPKGPAPKLSDSEIKRRLQNADAAYELGKAYYNMGLKKEAEPELQKSLGFYRELIEGGFESSDVAEKIVNVESWLGLRETAEKKEESAAEPVSQKAEKSETKAGEEKVTVKAPEKKENKKKTEEKPEKKKRDKRMGFV